MKRVAVKIESLTMEQTTTEKRTPKLEYIVGVYVFFGGTNLGR